jgi:single-strand selective monofunctional uracil DNA glycosylase
MDHPTIINNLLEAVRPLTFGPPVTHVYNPLDYAREPYDLYLDRFGQPAKEVILLGMNPGPFGMVQTGVPFGEVTAVTEWMGIRAPVRQPETIHPRRPITGFDCKRKEVSGQRLWGWVQGRFRSPEAFFDRFFVANYCPLVFMEASGRNRTPNTLKAAERRALFDACDTALFELVRYLSPRLVVGVGKFAADRARAALAQLPVTVGQMLHPSPASPKANQGWQPVIEQELADLGVQLPRL